MAFRPVLSRLRDRDNRPGEHHGVTVLPTLHHPTALLGKRLPGIATLVLTGLVAATSVAQPVRAPRALEPPAESHPLDVRDLWAMQRVADPQPSPDGRWVVFASREFDVQANTSRSNLWLVPIEGGELRRLTTADARDGQPRWSPDGSRVAFLSNRSGSSQIWVIRIDAGEARQLTDLPVDVESFQWSPDGQRLAFVAAVYPDCATLECTAERADSLDAGAVQARVYDALLYRHWDTWDCGRRKHILVMPVSGGEPVDVLRGADLDAPPPPWGGSGSWAWSPGGLHITFQGRTRNAEASWTTDLDLYLGAADGSGFECITEPNLAEDSHPVFAPHGDRIAYLAMKRAGYEADRRRIVLYDPEKRSRRTLTETWDRSPLEMVWSPSGKRLYVTVREEGRRAVYAVATGDARLRRLPMPGSVRSLRAFRAPDGERLLFLLDSLTRPADVYTCKADGSDPRRLTRFNDELLSRIRMSTPERIRLDGAKGDVVHAWLLPPVNHEPGRRYPLVLLIHGGPQGSWEDRFHTRWNLQLYAAAGFAVVAPDFHGSSGYGQAFTDAIRKDWGGRPYEDLMKAVDHVVATVPYVDGDRLGAAGASYGGYMINWIAGQTDRFRCLVNHAGLFDLRNFYGATEEQWFPEWEFGGTPWEKPENYKLWSPSNYVKYWETPMLVIHGGLDYRVPESEGFATFTALQRRGIPSKFLHFPDENHWVLKPQNAILWQDTILDWLERWLVHEPGASGSE
ncbi:MAG: prolyl oligopeptidase family serine peptidase [Candidatus Krumholzibacteriia bacterium]